jgi:hypothetical protein
MSRATWILCSLIARLDRIPRYGRLYPLRPRDPDNLVGPARWTWQRRGHWGLNLLNRLGLLWQYIDEAEWRHNAASRPVRGRTDDGD